MSWLNNEEGGVLMKKLIVCLAILAVTGYAQAQPDKLIGSWEDEHNEGWADHPATAATGWTATVYVDDPLVMPSVYVEFSYDWSTEGWVSLKANVTGWNWFQRADFHADYFTYNAIEFDVYAVLQDGSTATYAQIEQIAFSTETNGWFNPGASTGFDIGFDTAKHCKLDYSAYKTSDYASSTDTYGSVIFAYNADAPIYVYMDNVMLTPEPATIGLLGLGGLALLRRKR
jgi:hypothetical protein